MIKELQNFIQETTDEFIVWAFIGSAIAFVFIGITVPEWFTMGVGLILVHYFQKKK